jgi:hypothetical protein
MKHIYFYMPGADSSHILSEGGIGCTSYGFYHFTDILGRIYRLPIINTLIWEEDWDGVETYLNQRFKDGVKELKGEPTGRLLRK